MRAESTAGIYLCTFETLGQFANVMQDPSVLDYVKMDVAALDVARSNSVPERALRTPKEVAVLKQQRAKQMQQQQQIQAAPAAAAMMKAQQGQQK